LTESKAAPRAAGGSHEVIPVTVYIAQGQLEANVVKAKLQSEGIPAILQYESAGVVYGMTLDGLGQVRVQVPEPLAETARAIIAEATLPDDLDDEDDDVDEGEEDGDGEEGSELDDEE
jgi:hypothetical protein